MTTHSRGSWSRWAAPLAIAATLTLAACNVSDLLKVTDPDVINPSDVQSAAGASAIRLGAIARLNFATSGGSANSEGLFLLSGLLTDEWNNGDSFIDRQSVDERVIIPSNSFLTDVDRMLHRARLSAAQAILLLNQYSPNGPRSDVAEMYFVQAYVENSVGESFCNGLILSTVVDGTEQYGSPISTTAAFTLALAHADSGLALITGTTAADVRVRNALMVVRGRIFLNLNQPAAAATAVAGVPTSFKYQNLHSQSTSDNQVWAYNNVARRYSISTNEGTNGLNFATANDPRIPVCNAGDPVCVANGTSIKTRDDGSLPLYIQLIWPTRDASVTIAGGVEARMIEAEAAFRAGDPAGTIAKLNQARTEGGVAGLPATLTDPGTDPARVDLIFRERAFWLFSTGHRLGDMRRLIKFYNRSAESVFPTGAWIKGGNYGTDVNFPVPQAEQNNPNLPSAQTCTDRNA
ncbi:MAG: hypothetical protein ABI119_10575 [Gemmatimonadaceae bacterium]